MPSYGEAAYWDDRYEREKDTPFDWLFDFQDVKEIIFSTLPNKDERILLVGCGNAPFSPDLYEKGGYKNAVNTDISSVVINQQRQLFPEQQWQVMDVLHMPLADGSVPAIIDKSLIDTLLCTSDSATQTREMVTQLHRVLAPGGRLLTFSLHGLEEALPHYQRDDLSWRVSAFRVQSTRWDEDEHFRRAVAHTLIICDKPDADGSFRWKYPLSVPGTLSDSDYAVLRKHADQVILRKAMGQVSNSYARLKLLRALCPHGSGVDLSEEFMRSGLPKGEARPLHRCDLQPSFDKLLPSLRAELLLVLQTHSQP